MEKAEPNVRFVGIPGGRKGGFTKAWEDSAWGLRDYWQRAEEISDARRVQRAQAVTTNVL